MRKYPVMTLISFFMLALLGWQPARAQAETQLKLSLSRDWGYGGGGEIQGLFSMHISGPADLERVVFMIDEQQIGEDTEAPFAFQFTTDSYTPGLRTMSAVGYTSNGQELHSNEISAVFLSKAESDKKAAQVIVPILGLVAGIFVIIAIGSIVTLRQGKRVPLGQERKYSILGGAICPKCSRPFPMPLLGFNVGLGKLMPCPHCGKWSVMRSRSLAELRAAEAAELGTNGAALTPLSEEEKLRKELDDSRYQGM